MARPRENTDPASERLTIRLTTAQADTIDSHRGTRSRAGFVRDLISALVMADLDQKADEALQVMDEVVQIAQEAVVIADPYTLAPEGPAPPLAPSIPVPIHKHKPYGQPLRVERERGLKVTIWECECGKVLRR